MATKLYNSHLKELLENCNEYYILDTYISLVHLSSEVKGKYLIQTYTDSLADLISATKATLKATYKTIYNCINKLISLGILGFDRSLNAWVILDMENMHLSKSDSSKSDKEMVTGYTHMRTFFLSDTFSSMKAREKRVLIYMAQLSDSKAGKFHGSYSMNLLKINSPWLKVLKTKCKYYAKYTIEKMLSKYSDIFNDLSTIERSQDISPVRNKTFKFFFNCELIKNKNNEEDNINAVFSANSNEYKLIVDKIKFFKITLSKTKIMHLIRGIAPLKEWALKERVVQLIINKYIAIQIHKSRENIKSLPAYTAAVVKSVVDEYNSFKELLLSNKTVPNYQVGEFYLDHFNLNSSDLTMESINSTLALL